ncbi:2-keto-4-pentenoate hydratase [Labrenzia sp. CE80]|uniref:2-keto-4-pentenoate hydratase n=1 Tax=Labrenzia sp. CE80 TaxID=1788986 RepID=UPI00129B23CB|nr:2-keto-4-pentenoate hydratase [Labrenzia sp. CE80]
MSIEAAAQLIVEARRAHTTLARLPKSCRLGSEADGYAVQKAVAGTLGLAVAGWKVAARSSNSGVAAPIFAGTVHQAPVTLPHVNALETEIAFKLKHDLPVRYRQPYSRQEILNAIQSVALAFELVDWRLTAVDLDVPERVADCFANAGLVLGLERPFIGDISSPVKELSLFRDQTPEPFQAKDIDPVESIRAYVNYGGDTLGGLKAGHWVITGSLSGIQKVSCPETWTARWREELEVSLRIAARS